MSESSSHPDSPAAEQQNAERQVVRVLVGTSVIGKTADYGLMLVAPLAVLGATGSVAGAILTFALRGVAYAISPIIGVYLDRYERRGMFAAAQVQQALCVVVAALFLDREWVVAAALFLSGLGGVAASLSSQFVLIPELIAPDNRARVVARVSSSIEFAKVLGFLGGGVVLAALDARAATLGIAALYGIAGLWAMRLPRVPVQPARTSLRGDLAVGFRWLVKPEIGWLVLSMAVSNLALGGLGSVLVTLMGDRGTNPTLISATLAIGLFIGAWGAQLTPRALPSWSLQARILLFQALAAVGFGLLVLEPPVWVVILAWSVNSFALGLSNVVSITYRQEAIPVHLAGRINSVIRMFIAGAVPLSGMTYALAEARGWWLWGPAVVLEAAALLIWLLHTVRGNHDRQLTTGGATGS
ncbi:MFS transporter [Micromonospora auratinigra]|uniref:Predicted arabinose efflux permease, MFS family n=1 Tax=Micromonospora auratinigra TaxID=261654 RepID=A0A1A8Z5F9_9ACTN|nr:MFS transporter [Micromonospora auratinigra]SBT39089.1 Predicted arabinose efflux permease, MFS family [Micromonospora auratinigra]